MEYSLTEESELQVLDSHKYEMAKSFFIGFPIYEIFLHSILDSRSAGTVFTGDKNNPSFVLVCSPSTPSIPNAYAYLEGKLDESAVRKVASYLKKLPKISLVAPLNSEYRDFFEKEGFVPVERMQLKKTSDFNLDTWKLALPGNYSIATINHENFTKCNWHSFVLDCYENADQFFRNGIGFCLLDEGKVASESYGVIANGKAEFIVTTNENYRGQNLGTIVSAVMIDYCYKNSLVPYWNCDVKNLASLAVAKKLGFQEECKHLFLKWTSVG